MLMCAGAAHADLIAAQKAYAAEEYPRALELFREIAEIGNVTAQENVAAMYVDGQGVARDNILGYAWAVIARENGGNAAMQNIIDQIAPHLNDAAQARVALITGEFGAAALQERLLPNPPRGLTKQSADYCRFTRPSNPDDFHPSNARNISGTALVEGMVLPDGRVHHAFVRYSVPAGVFENAARANTLSSGFAPRRVDGVAVPCALLFKIKFVSKDSHAQVTSDSAYAKARSLAEAGDPIGQAAYGLMKFAGAGTDANGELPRDWLLKSAQAGVPYAQYVVGIDLMGQNQPRFESETAKGLKWLRMAATAGQSDAAFALANYTLNHESDATSNPMVFAWLEGAAKDGHRDGTLFLAALLAAGPDAAHRDPKRALELMDKIAPLVDFEPTSFEVRATAHANLGDFKTAQREQQRAMKDARKLGWDVAPLEARMARFETGQPWNGFLFLEWPALESPH